MGVMEEKGGVNELKGIGMGRRQCCEKLFGIILFFIREECFTKLGKDKCRRATLTNMMPRLLFLLIYKAVVVFLNH